MLGDIINFDFREGIIYKWPIMSDFAFRKETGGGVLADIGVHILDLLLWWLGNYDSFEYYDDAMGGVEADCELHLKLKSGATGIVQLSRTRDLRNTCIIQGERGSLEIETTFNSQIKLKINGQSLNLTGRAISEGMAEERAEDIFSRQLQDFQEAIRHNQPPLISTFWRFCSMKNSSNCSESPKNLTFDKAQSRGFLMGIRNLSLLFRDNMVFRSTE